MGDNRACMIDLGHICIDRKWTSEHGIDIKKVGKSTQSIGCVCPCARFSFHKFFRRTVKATAYKQYHPRSEVLTIILSTYFSNTCTAERLRSYLRQGVVDATIPTFTASIVLEMRLPCCGSAQPTHGGQDSLLLIFFRWPLCPLLNLVEYCTYDYYYVLQLILFHHHIVGYITSAIQSGGLKVMCAKQSEYPSFLHIVSRVRAMVYGFQRKCEVCKIPYFSGSVPFNLSRRL